MGQHNVKGEYAEEAFKRLFPNAVKTEESQDKNGTDFLLGNNRKIQVKYDETIGITGNVYFEVEERSFPGGPWRKSALDADIYYFIYPKNYKKNKAGVLDGSIIFIKVTVDDYHDAVTDKRIREIKPTSKGYLVPLEQLRYKELTRYFPELNKVKKYKEQLNGSK